jgi:hypothetical protein
MYSLRFEIVCLLTFIIMEYGHFYSSILKFGEIDSAHRDESKLCDVLGLRL